MALSWPGAGGWMDVFLLPGRGRCFCDMLVWLFRSEAVRGVNHQKRSRLVERGKPVTVVLLFPCPLCGRHENLLRDKKGRAYFRCKNCRARLFAPVDPGQKRLIERSEKVVRK